MHADIIYIQRKRKRFNHISSTESVAKWSKALAWKTRGRWIDSVGIHTRENAQHM